MKGFLRGAAVGLCFLACGCGDSTGKSPATAAVADQARVDVQGVSGAEIGALLDFSVTADDRGDVFFVRPAGVGEISADGKTNLAWTKGSVGEAQLIFVNDELYAIRGPSIHRLSATQIENVFAGSSGDRIENYPGSRGTWISYRESPVRDSDCPGSNLLVLGANKQPLRDEVCIGGHPRPPIFDDAGTTYIIVDSLSPTQPGDTDIIRIPAGGVAQKDWATALKGDFAVADSTGEVYAWIPKNAERLFTVTKVSTDGTHVTTGVDGVQSENARLAAHGTTIYVLDEGSGRLSVRRLSADLQPLAEEWTNETGWTADWSAMFLRNGELTVLAVEHSTSGQRVSLYHKKLTAA